MQKTATAIATATMDESGFLEAPLLRQAEDELKNNTWNIRHLDDESFVQPSHRAIVIYFRLSDF